MCVFLAKLFGIQTTSFMHCIILPLGTCLAVPFSSTLSHTGMIKRKVINHERCVVIFCITFLWNISNSKKNSNRYKCRQVFKWSACYSFQVLIKLEFSWQIFLKFSLENPSNVSQVVVCEQTDTRELIVAFCNFVDVQENHMRMLTDAIFSVGCKGCMPFCILTMCSTVMTVFWWMWLKDGEK